MGRGWKRVVYGLIGAGCMVAWAIAIAESATVTLAWDAPDLTNASPLNGYVLYRSGGGLPDPQPPVCSVGAATLTCADTDVAPGTYRYVVVADYGEAGVSKPSNEAIVEVIAPPPSPVGSNDWVVVLLGAILSCP